MPKTFIVTDESVNCYGFRVLTKGIDITQFLRNPLMLWMHRRARGFSKNDEPLPLGTWSNLKQGDNNTLLADSNFDIKDEFAKTISDKVEQAIIKMSSIGIEIIETSSAPELMLPGQTLPTVTKCKLMEISIVDMGGNDNALALYNSGGEVINLSLGTLPEFFKLDKTETEIKNSNIMKLVALQLGLPENATETEICAAILKLQSDHTTLNANFATLDSQVKLQQKAVVKTLLDNAQTAGKFTAEKRANFEEMASKVGIETLSSILESMVGAVRPTDLIKGKTPGAIELKWDDVAKGGVTALEKWKAEDKEAYVLAYEAKFETKYIEPKA